MGPVEEKSMTQWWLVESVATRYPSWFQMIARRQSAWWRKPEARISTRRTNLCSETLWRMSAAISVPERFWWVCLQKFACSALNWSCPPGTKLRKYCTTTFQVLDMGDLDLEILTRQQGCSHFSCHHGRTESPTNLKVHLKVSSKLKRRLYDERSMGPVEEMGTPRSSIEDITEKLTTLMNWPGRPCWFV